MLIRKANDVLMSQAQEEETTEVERSIPQKLIVTSAATRNSIEIIFNPEQRQEIFRANDDGRTSVVSDPGYISCTGSDHSSVLSVGGEASPEDCGNYNTTPEYNAVISPCNTSITDVLNDTYIASSRASPISDTESTFGPPEHFMPASPHPNLAAENLGKTLCDRARSLQEGSRLNQAMPATMNWSSEQQNSAMQSGNYDQRIDFDMFFDGVLETKYTDLTMDNSTSSIFSNSNDNHQRNIVSPFVQQPGIDLTQSQGCRNNVLPDDFLLSIEDFCFDEYDMGCNSNMHETIHTRTLSPSTDFSSNEMPLQQRPQQFINNTSLQYARYQESSSRKPYDLSTHASRRTNGVANRRMQSRVFARNSAEKTDAAIGPSATDGKEAVQTPTSAEEEAWRSYLENPLTAATTAMMSFHGDEDSAAALGLLYDYYKVPWEKRLLSYPTKMTDMAHGRTMVPQKNTASALPTTCVASVSQRGIPSSTNGSLDVKKVGVDVVMLHPVKSEPKIGTQAFESVAEIIKQHRPTAIDESKVKKEIIPESPQDLSTAFSESERNLVSASTPRIYSTNNNNNHNSNAYRSSSTSNYTTLSPYTTSLQSCYSVENSGSAYSGEIFEYVMEAPKSLKQKEGEPTMSYINKGQFYCITLRNASDQWKFKSSRVKSVIQLVFGDGKTEEEQQRHWKYWHARQHTVKQRIIDIADYKESNMIYDVDEISHNAISFSWNVNEVAKIFISCNSLSTDFSAQKGIKGLPLLVQIDTYVDGQETPFHRSVCQIKVFCDKGAERKIRDEERKATKRRQKNSKHSSSVSGNSSTSSNLMTTANPELKQIVTSSATSSTQYGPNAPRRTDFVIFKTTKDIETRPVLFIPEIPGHTSSSHQTPVISSIATPSMPPHITLHSMAESDQSCLGDSEFVERGVKRSHVDDETRGPAPKVSRVGDNERVLLYVRQPNDKVYDGLMLKTPDLNGLKLAIQEKYKYAAENIRNIFKKSKKGILVRMDDNIVRHYSNEDTFVIDIYNEVDSDVTTYNVTFTEV